MNSGELVPNGYQWYHWGMNDHRIRLNDSDIDLICAALRARAPMAGEARAKQIQRLLDRLEDGGRGNPKLRFGGEQWEAD